MEILKSSKIIQNMFFDYENENENENIDFTNETKLLFNEFITNKNLQISFQRVIHFIKKFEIICNCENIFTDIINTQIDNYFCLKNNKMVITSFIILFFKIDNNNYDITQINNHFIFDFFVELGEFFNFMDFLDVDNTFLNNLKAIITLYALQLDRRVIEERFHYIIEILDIFFSNEIIPRVFIEVNFNKLRTYKTYIEKYEKSFTKNYNEDIKININNFVSSNDILIANNILEQIPINNETIYNDEHYDVNNDIYEYTNETSETSETQDILKRDIKFYTLFNCKNVYVNTLSFKDRHKYIKLLIIRYYQKITEKYENYMKIIRNLCLGIKINNYVNFKPNIKKTIVLLHIKIFIGIEPNIETISKYLQKENNLNILTNIINDLIFCSCRLGYFNLFKQCFDLYKDTICVDKVMFCVINRANSIVPYEFENYLKTINFKRYISDFNDIIETPFTINLSI